MEIAIFLFDGVTALDAVGPYESLARIAEANVTFVAKTTDPVRTGDGMLAFQPSADLSSTRGADVLIVPGGHPRGLRETIADADILAWIRALDETSRWTCSVCTGALILGAAGLLEGRKAATHWRAKAALPRFGVEYSADRVTTDGKYMTSAGVSAGIDMGLRLCGELAGRQVAEAIELSMQYDPAPPYGTGDAARFATPERVALIETALRR